jgi:UTP--glucose-1-phosphate uridylyltransferase
MTDQMKRDGVQDAAEEAFAAPMQREGIDERAVDAFLAMLRRFRAGETGKVPWSEIAPPNEHDIVDHAGISSDPENAAVGASILDRLVVISLNGGLGTTMRLERAKSLIPVREGMSFLEIKARQVAALRARSGHAVPWLLMNSFRTREDSLAALADRGLEVGGLPLDFLQNKIPRIDRATVAPAELDDPEERWCPPGHGDLFLALLVSGLLGRLLDRRARWAFVSNIDNLGSTVDLSILGHLERRGADFAMEVTPKSHADVKGGTLIRHRGRLSLLEIAQVEKEHLQDFQDISIFTDFNTNSLWFRLDALQGLHDRGSLVLPLIVNPKTILGRDVVQLETAMGAAVGCFDHAVGIRVPRSRFAPVKATCDLLAIRSDAYTLDGELGIRSSSEREEGLGPPVVVLDDRFYKGLEDFESRFPHPVSLVRARRLTVEGDVRFGRDVRVVGEVIVRNAGAGQRTVPDGTLLANRIYEP